MVKAYITPFHYRFVGIRTTSKQVATPTTAGSDPENANPETHNGLDPEGSQERDATRINISFTLNFQADSVSAS